MESKKNNNEQEINDKFKNLNSNLGPCDGQLTYNEVAIPGLCFVGDNYTLYVKITDNYAQIDMLVSDEQKRDDQDEYEYDGTRVIVGTNQVKIGDKDLFPCFVSYYQGNDTIIFEDGKEKGTRADYMPVCADFDLPQIIYLGLNCGDEERWNKGEEFDRKKTFAETHTKSVMQSLFNRERVEYCLKNHTHYVGSLDNNNNLSYNFDIATKTPFYGDDDKDKDIDLNEIFKNEKVRENLKNFDKNNDFSELKVNDKDKLNENKDDQGISIDDD